MTMNRMIQLGKPPNTLLIPEWLLAQTICTHRYQFFTIQERAKVYRCSLCEKLKKEPMDISHPMQVMMDYKSKLSGMKAIQKVGE